MPKIIDNEISRMIAVATAKTKGIIETYRDKI